MTTLSAPTLTPTRAFAELAAEFRGGDIPEGVLACIEECIFDLVGHTAYAARYAESSAAFRSGARALDPEGRGSTVIGESATYSPVQAALLNGAYAHTMDFDDTNGAAGLHPGAPIIPVAFGVAERSGATGRELVEAVTLGYEITCRIGTALGLTAYDRGFHMTGVAGVFGAVAAAGRLQGLDAATIESAFGLAGSLAAGSMQYLENGAWNKRLHPGFAGQSALTALAFAKAGVLAAHEPLGGRFGLLNGYSNAPRPEALTDSLGVRWLAADTAIKPYPSCRLTHGAIDGALALREQLTATQRPGAVLHIELGQKAFDIVGEDLPGKRAPRNIVDGQFSVYYQAACAWADGKFDWQSYERLGAVDVEALAARMRVSVDPGLKVSATRVTVEASQRLVLDVPLPSGEPSTPLGRPRLTKKFMSLAAPVYGEAASREIAARLLNLRQERSAAEVLQSLRLPGG